MERFINRTASILSMQAQKDYQLLSLTRENRERVTRTIPAYALYQIINRAAP